MKINNINFSNFKGLYYVQARKDMFKKPNQPLECESEFRDMIDFASNMYGSKPKEFTVYLESPGHEMALRALKKTTFSNCSVPWLNKNAKTRIFEGLKDGYYSFFVATDKDADEFSVFYEKKSLIKAVRNFEALRILRRNFYQNGIIIRVHGGGNIPGNQPFGGRVSGFNVLLERVTVHQREVLHFR